MRATFEVTEPNPATLLTVAEARAALGIVGMARDADLTRLIARISAAIFRACKIASDGTNPPTLMSESVTETFRLSFTGRLPLRLSRRRVTAVESVTLNGTEMDESTYDVDRSPGIISFIEMYRGRPSGASYCLPSDRIVVEYTAGFTEVPDDLKLAAEIWLRSLWRDAYETPSEINDPLVKVVDVPGVERVERWVNPTVETLLPPEVKAILIDGGYIETWVA
ncbi:hypothetical protein LB523_12055 [Mesorhizobium sp. ESP-6-4]|uniref:hypothetical protein n=1 Tax=Mesorhizobium sp. ESP-6-4 TaxID=2876624 RepID=UPI001CCB3E08|nr:hypothetical protein [Mesorhizobium sp. ESP-6-4]MBZ9659779.1 hypothetical protein [Mesorhizobium sp. ESP-6-4]